MLIAHLSDLHLRDAGDAIWLERQLDRIAAREPAHLAITGDLLDRWVPPLLDRVLDMLASRDLLHADRLTILHGNHDLASSGGHPRRGADLWRLAARFWDPPPLIRWRRRRFYAALRQRAPGIGSEAPWLKILPAGVRLAVLDTVPVLWRPLRLEPPAVVVQHAVGCVRRAQATWLSGQRGTGPLVILTHHYPLETPRFAWTPQRASPFRLQRVEVPMHIPPADRAHFWEAASAAGAGLVLCGHVHRARLEHHRGIAVGLNGQSGAAWAGRPVAWYRMERGAVTMELETE